MRLDAKTWALLPLAAALNITGGWLTSALKIPLYLDSLGTIWAACLGGPLAGAATALISGLISAAANSPIWLCFLPPALLVGLVAGYLSRQGFMRNLGLAALMGIILGLTAALASAPIAAYVLHGSSGGGTDLVVAAFRLAGLSTLHACLAQSLATDPIDKLISCLLVQSLLTSMPTRLRNSFQNGANLDKMTVSGYLFKPQQTVLCDACSLPTMPSASLSRGFYRPGTSFLHKLTAETKEVLLIFATAAALSFPLTLSWPDAQGNMHCAPLAYLPVLALALGILSCLGDIALPFSRTLLLTAVPLSASMILINGFLGPSDFKLALGDIGNLNLSIQAAVQAAQTALRITIICEAALLLLFTTKQEELMRSLESKGVPSKFAYAVLAAINLAPQMVNRAQRLLEIQAARAMPWGGTLKQKITRILPLAAPLVLTAAYEAEQTALTLTSRGFGAAKRRTYLSYPTTPWPERLLQVALIVATILLLLKPLF